MRILRNHLLREFSSVFLTSTLSLLFVFLLGRGLVQMADLIFNKDVDFFLVLKMLFFSLPFILIFVIPMSVLVSSLLVFGKLSADNEITAIRASGISLLKVLQPIVMFTVALCLFSFLLSDQLASVSHYHYRRLVARIGLESPAAALEEGTFIKKFKNFVIYVYEIEKTKLKGVRIYQPQEGKPTRTIIAQKGEIIAIPEKNILKLKLIHGTSDEPDPKDPAKLYKLNFKTYDLPLSLVGLKNSEATSKKPKDMSIREIRKEIEELGEAGIKATYPLTAEIQNKIALAFSSLAFLLVGTALGITTRRGEKSIGFGMSLALAMLYWVLLIGGKALAQKGLAPPMIAMQFSNFVVGGLGIFLYVKMERN